LDGKVIAHNRATGAIQIGFGSVGIVDKKYCRTIWGNGGTIEFMGNASFGRGTKISCGGYLKVGDKFHVSANSDLVCEKDVKIGDDVLISWQCLIMDTDFHSIYRKGTIEKINPDKTICIGNHVWIGCRTTILKGSKIPNNSVIAACSVVTSSHEEQNAIYAGNNLLKHDIEWQP
jgi:acetyltransferase-like isoleucine patch superfamily enzyme